MRNILKLLCLMLAAGCSAAVSAAGIAAWDRPLRGVMVSERIGEEDIAVLNDWNVNLVRWQLRWQDFPKSPADTADAAAYDRWLGEALAHFDTRLPLLRKYGIRVVLDLHTPPGGRIHPGAACRMFTEAAFQKQFIETWKRIAARYRGNPDIIGYDLMNEPVVPAVPGEGCRPWRELASDAVRAIRNIDPEMPIVFENQQWAIPNTLTNFRPLPFRDVIYSIHFYYPYEVAFQGLNGSPAGIEYPGTINGEMWDRARLEKELLPVIDLQKKHDVRIFIGEFSCIRWAPEGTGRRLLADMISIFEERKWAWTYHAFREWSGWSVEHSRNPAEQERALCPTDREQLLREAFSQNRK